MAWAAEASAQEDAGVEMTQAPIQFESPSDASVDPIAARSLGKGDEM